jgi:16S rRNA (guanine527-N7)-methyltransferase
LSQQPHPMREISGPDDFKEAFSVSRETLERLKTYEALLQKWQKTINLVAPSTLKQVWHRHFADSAQILALAPQNQQNWVDLGSGAGFPGLVVAILLAPDTPKTQTPVTLIESDSRKAAFLREVARAVAVPVDILPLRIEAAPTRISVTPVDVVSARALAPLEKLLELSQPLMKPTTAALFLKGRDVSREVQDAEIKWKFNIELTQSVTDADARIVRITNLSRRTPTSGATP